MMISVTKRKPVKKPEPIEVHLTIDVGPHLSHLFKRLFPKGQQGTIDNLANKLKDSTDDLQDAIETNTPKSK